MPLQSGLEVSCENNGRKKIFNSGIFAELLLKKSKFGNNKNGDDESVEKYIVKLAELNLTAFKTRITFYERPDFKSGHLFEQKTVFILAAMGVASFFFCKKEKDKTDSATALLKEPKSICSSIFLILLVFAFFSK